MLTVGRELTVTVVVCVVVPPGPVHASSYSVVVVSLPVDHWPLVAMGPCQPPLAAQVFALVAAQVSVATP
jgi:hypothetical protein